MARPTSAHTDEVRRRLRQRLADGLLRPGSRFLSNRALAARFGISYQTAHRLIGELVAEGKLERRAAKGTYVAGYAQPLGRLSLLFHPRAKRRGSFGDYLLKRLTRALADSGIVFDVKFTEDVVAVSEDTYALIWENPALGAALARSRRYALLLNDRPPPGLAASFLDSVSTDDFSGGLCAAEVIEASLGRSAIVAVVAGPKSDGRSELRVSGFLSIFASAPVVHTADWTAKAAGQLTRSALRSRPQMVFCASDRLAEGVLNDCKANRIPCPAIVSFDDAPVAHDLNLTTIAIPWDSLVSGAVALIQRRMSGDSSTASQQIFAPRPIIRGSHLLL